MSAKDQTQAAARSDVHQAPKSEKAAQRASQGLPVHGYVPQSPEAIALVNENKVLEELVLRQIDRHRQNAGIDQRMVSEAFTAVQDAFMWLNRSVFQPKRISLPGDTQ